MPSAIRPASFAHVVYRTYRFDEMADWYQMVLGAKVQYRNPVLAFLTYDEEHHRVALINLELVKPGTATSSVRAGPGVDHVAYGFTSLSDLLTNHERLKSLGITPYWTIHHGVTVSLYYADPDGNQMEFQVDSFDSVVAANDFMLGPHFEANPIGVEFDPDEMLAALRSGVPEKELLRRKCDLPLPAMRGPDQQDDSALIGGGSRHEPAAGQHGRIRQEVRYGNEPGPVSSGAADARVLRELRDAGAV